MSKDESSLTPNNSIVLKQGRLVSNVAKKWKKIWNHYNLNFRILCKFAREIFIKISFRDENGIF